MKTLSIATALVFVISLVFPIAAGLSHDTAAFPHWWVPADVAIAFVLALLAFALIFAARHGVTTEAERATYHAYRVLLQGVLALCAVFLLAGGRIVWPNCLPGLAWRTWLFLYCLPWWLAAFHRIPAQRNRSAT